MHNPNSAAVLEILQNMGLVEEYAEDETSDYSGRPAFLAWSNNDAALIIEDIDQGIRFETSQSAHQILSHTPRVVAKIVAGVLVAQGAYYVL